MAPLTDADIPALPERTRLLHIGPHKTGTTSLQGALWTARDAMREQGVRHAGRTRNPSNAVRAVVGQPSPYSDTEPPSINHWRTFVRDIDSARESRVVVSSEFFAWAKPDAIRRIVEDLDLARVHVVVTLRPLARIMPSMWQQNIQAGQVRPFVPWLDGVLRDPPEQANAAFWTLHRHDRLITRWAEVVGVDRVTAVVVDERDHGFLLRTFERLLGLREGTLAVAQDFTNRSLTLPESEAVRAFNVAFKAEGLPRAVHARMMRFGAAQEMKRRQPAADEPRVELPDSAVERVAEIATEVVAGIEASGVRVIGDLGVLIGPTTRRAAPGTGGPASAPDGPAAVAPASTPGGPAAVAPVALPPEVAASMAMGILVASGQARTPALGRGLLQAAEPIELARVPTSQLAAYAVLRAVRDVARLAWRVREKVLRR